MTDNQKQTKPSAPEYRSAQIGSLIAPAIPPSRTMQEIFQQQSKMNSRTTEILSSSEPSKAWIIDRLPPTVPKGHLLERTTFDVHDMTPQEVADRLSNCLRFHSIHCQASEENKVCAPLPPALPPPTTMRPVLVSHSFLCTELNPSREQPRFDVLSNFVHGCSQCHSRVSTTRRMLL